MHSRWRAYEPSVNQRHSTTRGASLLTRHGPPEGGHYVAEYPLQLAGETRGEMIELRLHRNRALVQRVDRGHDIFELHFDAAETLFELE